MRWPWRSVLVALALAATTGASAVAESEHYENVRIDAGITGSFVAIGDRNGAGMVMEIKGMAHDNLAIGGRVEFAVMFGGAIGEDKAPLDIAMAASGLIKGEYLVGSGLLRPFVGMGVGGYTIGSQTIDAGPSRDGIRSSTGRYVGIAPQLGIDIGRVRVAATYNAILGAYIELHQTIGTTEETTRLSQSYLSLEVSFRFGGGRKKGVPGPARSARSAVSSR